MDNLEYLRHSINWWSDHAAGFCDTKPAHSVDHYQAEYLKETGYYWDPVNAVDISAADAILGVSEAVDDRAHVTANQSTYGRMMTGLDQLIESMPTQTGIETITHLLDGLDVVMTKNGGLTDDELWLYTTLLSRQFLLKEKREADWALDDKVYELQHPNDLPFSEVDEAWIQAEYDNEADRAEARYQARRAAQEYKYDGR